jgi:hypothetical protein
VRIIIGRFYFNSLRRIIMCRKLIYLVSFVLVLSFILTSTANAGDPSLVGWWRFDEGSGSVAADSSGNGLDGTIEGAIWTAGKSGSALEFDGADDAVRIPEFATGEAQTITAWIKIDSVSSGQKQMFNGNGPPHMNFELADGMIEGRVYTGSTNITLTGPEVPVGDWTHVAWAYDHPGNRSELFIDGVSVALGEASFTVAHTSSSVIGRHPTATTASFLGVIDDVRVYSRALTEAEILAAMGGAEGFPYAFGPKPKDGTMLEATWANMSWRPGDFAVTHDVYFGDNFDDVNDGAESTFVGNQTATNLIVGFPGFVIPEGLVPGTTYYWRIDEVNDADPNSPWKGDVWSFFIPPRTAYDPIPVDGVKFVVPDVELSWTAGFNAKLHYVFFGDNFDDVNSAVVGLPQSETTYTPGTLELDKVYYWRVDEFDGAATHKGDVWSFKTLPDIPITNPNLVGWWKLDEGMGKTAVDWSGHGNHGMFESDPQWVDGYDGGALEFDGVNDFVVYSFDQAQTFAAFSLAFWVKASSLGQPNFASPFTGHYPNTAGFQIDVNGENPGEYRVNPSGLIFGTVSTDWVHLALTAEGTSAKIYYNGEWVLNGTLNDSTFNQFAIGVNRNRNWWFAGIIDDFRIYDKVLTDEEIQLTMRGDPLLAWGPRPTPGSTLYIRDATPLSWSQGDNASQHDVYFGTDRDAVADADESDTTGIYRGRQGVTFYTPPEVEWGGGPYYWRVDEYNTDATISKGRIWSFTVTDFIVIDDFEDYNDYEPDRIFETWIDGWGVETNGSEVGYAEPNFTQGEHHVETTIVHGGGQSMPYFYENNFKYSEATMTLVWPRDWTEEGVGVLSLWFYGDAANAAERMYVNINGIAMVYHDNPDAVLIEEWTEWRIDLQEFAAQGVNLANVNTISIGFGDKNNLQAGGSGMVLFDDIRLYRPVLEAGI